jgi:hypothetical protein
MVNPEGRFFMFNHHVYQSNGTVTITSKKLLDASLAPRFWRSAKGGASAGHVFMTETDGANGDPIGITFEIAMGQRFCNQDLDALRSASTSTKAAPKRKAKAEAKAAPVAQDLESRMARTEALLTAIAEKLNL